MLFAGLAEGFGLSMLLPLLSLALNSSAEPGISTPQSESPLEQLVSGFFDTVGVSPTIGVLLIFFVSSILLKAILVLLANKRVGYMVARVATDLRLTLIHALFATRWEYYVHQPIGRFSNAFATEASRAAVAYSFGIKVIALLLHTAVYTIIALILAWQETLITLSAGVIILYVLRLLITKAKTAGKQQTIILKSVLALLTDTLQSIKPLRAMARENMAILVLQKKTKILNDALQSEVFSLEALKALQEALITIFFAFVLFVAIVWLEIPLATILILVFMLAKILKTLQKAQKEYQSMVIAESAYWSILAKIKETEKEQEAVIGTHKPSFNDSIRLQNVSFSYDQQPVLEEVSMTFPKGSFSAIIGPSGSGKTTVIDLITCLLIPQKGKVWIDETTLDVVDLKAWRRMIGYVPQDVALFHTMTVRENIAFGPTVQKWMRTEINDRVNEVASDLGITQLLDRKPDGLSGGERQRVALGRAICPRPHTLCLDEPLSALDEDTRGEIAEVLRHITRGHQITVLHVTHSRWEAEQLGDCRFRWSPDGRVLEETDSIP